MKKVFAILCLSVISPPLFSAGVLSTPETTNPGTVLNGDQWKSVISQFENSVRSETDWLEKKKTERIKLRTDIEGLEDMVSSLRQKNESNGNVIDEIRLKNLLNDLKDKLEKDSGLQHQWDDTQKDFEQKCLSLISLYNDRIEAELETTDVSSGTAPLDSKLKVLNFFIQKRSHVQTLLRQFQNKPEKEKLESVASLESIKASDREGLQLTLGLFRDRKKDLEERLEKLSLAEEELKNELKLDGKMQEFIDDIGRLKTDSNLPRGDPKNGELDGLAGKSQKEKLENQLADLRQQISHDEKILIQINLLLGRIQRQLDALGSRGKK